MSAPDEPTPMERAEHAANTVADLSTARRLLATLHCGDAEALQAICREFVASGRGVETTMATAMQALEFLAMRVPDPDDRQSFLDAIALAGMDQAAAARKFLRDIDGA